MCDNNVTTESIVNKQTNNNCYSSYISTNSGYIYDLIKMYCVRICVNNFFVFKRGSVLSDVLIYIFVLNIFYTALYTLLITS